MWVEWECGARDFKFVFSVQVRELAKRAQIFFFCLIHHSIMELNILSPVAPVRSKQRADRMDVDDESQPHLVNPGETVTTDQQFMRYIKKQGDRSDGG